MLSIAAIFPSKGQSIAIHKRVPIATPVSVSVNPYGNVFIGNANGTVSVYDSVGSLLNTYSSPTVANVTLIEAWQSLRVFLFYRELQEYLLLDRFLSPLQNYSRPSRIATPEIGFTRLATVASDGQLWLFDDTDFSLKKYNPLTHQISLQVPLELVLNQQDYQLTFIREYQNMVFLNDFQSGVLIFDNLGNFRKKIQRLPGPYIGFFGDELYFINEEKLYLVNLYSEKTRTLPLPKGANALYVILANKTIYLLSATELLIGSFTL